MTNKYIVDKYSKDCVCIALDHPSVKDTYMDGFIDIWTDGDDSPSPFQNIDDAKLFAEVIVKLLKTAPLLGEKKNDA